jgi:hypothetical protein
MTGLQKACHQILFYIIRRITLMREIQIIIAIVNNQIKPPKLLVNQVARATLFQLTFKTVINLSRSNNQLIMEQIPRIQGLEDKLKDLAT